MLEGPEGRDRLVAKGAQGLLLDLVLAAHLADDQLGVAEQLEFAGAKRGGARGNPGPAAAAAVLATPEGAVVESGAELIGRATNNVAEYRALLLGIERARALGASEVELIGDSELVVKQVRGEYRVKDSALRELHSQVRAALAGFDRWSIRHVRREQNGEADRLVNQALDEAAG